MLSLVVALPRQNAIKKIQPPDDIRFVSYGTIPTWAGVAADWHTSHPTLHLFDTQKYIGHSTYVAKVLKGCKTFEEFKTLVSRKAQRRYVPFFIYDLRQKPLTLNSSTYTWAVLVQDYRYTDSNADIAQMLLRLADLISGQWEGMSGKGIMILAKNEHNKINLQVAPALVAKGHANLTLDELRRKMGGKQQEILNEGKAVGKLRLIRSPKEAEQLTPNDIVVYDYLPLEVPPVAGIITLQPQTQLSHTAILAKNRGTVNVYVDGLNSLNNASNWIGKTVELFAYGRDISLKPIGASTVGQNTTPKSQNQTIQLPIARPKLGLGVWAFDSTPDSLLTVENMGTKAANYARLQQILGKDWVRPGYAVGYGPYWEVVAQQAKPYIEQLLSEKNTSVTTSSLRNDLDNIRQCILESKVPPETVAAIRQLIRQQYPYSRIRLRSSTNCEDLPQFNGAGLYESEGINAWENDKKLQKAVLKVYASLWNERAFREREYFGIDHRQAAIALHINEAFDNDNEWANGVLLAQKESRAGEWKILVNIQADHVLVTNPTGLGETPESFYLTAIDGRIGSIEHKSNRGDVLLNPQLVEAERLLRELAENTARVYEHFVTDPKNYGLDMEFKIVCMPDGELHLFFKQARLLKLQKNG